MLQHATLAAACARAFPVNLDDASDGWRHNPSKRAKTSMAQKHTESWVPRVAIVLYLLGAAAACTLQPSSGALSPGAALVELPDGRFRVSLWGARGVGGFGLRRWLVHGPSGYVAGSWTAGIEAATGRIRSSRSFTDLPRGAFADAAFGQYHGCALRAENRTAVCWGNSDDSKLAVSPGRGPFRRLVAGTYATCGIELLTSLGVCWGKAATGAYGTSINVPQDRALKALWPSNAISCFVEASTGALGCVGGDGSSLDNFPRTGSHESVWFNFYNSAGFAIRSTPTYAVITWGNGGALPVGRGPFLEPRGKVGNTNFKFCGGGHRKARYRGLFGYLLRCCRHTPRPVGSR